MADEKDYIHKPKTKELPTHKLSDDEIKGIIVRCIDRLPVDQVLDQALEDCRRFDAKIERETIERMYKEITG